MKKIILSLTLFSLLIASCKKEETPPPTTLSPPPPQPEIVTDIDGNDYTTIVVGSQEWLVENLRTSKYCNGDIIPNQTDNEEWDISGDLSIGTWAHYDNYLPNVSIYGKLYNWHAVNDERNICPCGWHVPSDAEWTILIDFLEGGDVAGGKLKSTGTQYWQSPNTDATNEIGFTARPGGTRFHHGIFFNLGNIGKWWSSTEYSAGSAWDRGLSYDSGVASRNSNNKGSGFSVRCIKD